MPASYAQSSFLGGEWNPLAQGRFDLPAYKQALAVSVNGVSVEEGAWVRRSGFQFLVPTYKRAAAKLLTYYTDFAINNGDPISVAVEFTPGAMRYFYGTGPLFNTNSETVTASSFASNLLTLTMAATTGFAVGDNVMLVAPASLDPAAIGPFRNRVMQVTATTGTTLTLGDDLGNVFSGITSAANALVGCVVYQILRTSTPYLTGDIQGLRMVQASVPTTASGAPVGVVLVASQPPYTLAIDNAGVTFAQTTFKDGPYLDQQGTFDTPETGTVNAYTGTITFTPASTTFTASDVGRMIRLFSQPAAWAVGTAYVAGNTVTYNGQWWVAIASSTGVRPGTLATSGGVQTVAWAPAPKEGQWAWGTISAQASTSCTVVLQTNLNSANGATIAIWRLGVFKSGQYPTCGMMKDGRLWLGGAVQNRFDASISNDIYTFSPTDVNNNVLASSAIDEVLNTDDENKILWMVDDHEGILMGTQTGEWLLDDGGTGTGITVDTIRARKVTKYGCANIEPRRAGMSLIFAQTIGRLVFEYLADAFTGKYSAKQLNKYAKHLTTQGVAEIVYQENPTPVIWCRLNDGSLVGCTYRRVSRFITEDPIVQAWHRHVLGGNYANILSRPLTGMAVTHNKADVTDYLYVATTDISGQNGWIEVGRPMFEAV